MLPEEAHSEVVARGEVPVEAVLVVAPAEALAEGVPVAEEQEQAGEGGFKDLEIEDSKIRRLGRIFARIFFVSEIRK